MIDQLAGAAQLPRTRRRNELPQRVTGPAAAENGDSLRSPESVEREGDAENPREEREDRECEEEGGKVRGVIGDGSLELDGLGIVRCHFAGILRLDHSQSELLEMEKNGSAMETLVIS